MSTKFFEGRRWMVTTATVAALAVTGFYGLRAAELGTLPFENPALSVKTATRSEAAAGRGYSAVVKRVVPAVVNISTSKMVKQTAMDMPEGMDPMFRQFFGNGGGQGSNAPRQRSEKALGSGVIISPLGYILTNNHVVEGATTVTVTLHDKREFKAKVIGTDPRTDIA